MSNLDKLKYKVEKSNVQDIAKDLNHNVKVVLQELDRDYPDMKLVKNKLQSISNGAMSINGLLNHDENEDKNVDLIDFYEELAEEMGISIACEYEEGGD